MTNVMRLFLTAALTIFSSVSLAGPNKLECKSNEPALNAASQTMLELLPSEDFQLSLGDLVRDKSEEEINLSQENLISIEQQLVKNLYFNSFGPFFKSHFLLDQHHVILELSCDKTWSLEYYIAD